MPEFVIGDLHGHVNDYRRLLQDADLADANGNWCGGDATLWLIGDFFDRGNYGLQCIDLTRSLQAQAASAGGQVNALLGNHEMMILCAYRFGDELTSAGMRVFDQWITWGGVGTDLENMTDEHAAWLSALPAMAMSGDTLLIHADAMLYVEHGRSVDSVNNTFEELLADDHLHRWENTLRAFAEHRAFSGLGITGQQRAEQVLRYYGARRLVHGHTPIPIAKGEPAEQVTEAWTYAGGRCINVDGGTYLGGPGFVHRLS
jgi:hypothetical protein